MKKVSLVAGLLSFSFIAFAQQKAPKNRQVNDSIVKVETTPGKRMMNPEVEIANLRASQIKTQNQSGKVELVSPATNQKKKLVVSRVGSKQLNWSKED